MRETTRQRICRLIEADADGEDVRFIVEALANVGPGRFYDNGADVMVDHLEILGHLDELKNDLRIAGADDVRDNLDAELRNAGLVAMGGIQRRPYGREVSALERVGLPVLAMGYTDEDRHAFDLMAGETVWVQVYRSDLERMAWERVA